jgi:hypothetical protein
MPSEEEDSLYGGDNKSNQEEQSEASDEDFEIVLNDDPDQVVEK